MKYNIFIPIRLDSKRLSKKSLKKINEKPIFLYLFERLKNIKQINDIVVCTTNKISDNELVSFLEKEKINFFRGDEKDILQRFFDAANQYESDFIIAIDGDDIYCDPDVVIKILEKFEETNADFITVEGLPVGFTPIGFKKSILEKICKLKQTKNTETGYGRFFNEKITTNSKKINIKTKNSFPSFLRMSLDYNEDFELAKKIFKKLGNNFHVDDILKFLSENPAILVELNVLQKKWNKHWNENLSDTSTRNI